MVKTQFGIKDLENLSNIKAHTIRIWEKRYKLLEPDRTDTNIRKYNIENLKKLLNIAYLYHAGHKISTIASYSQAQIQNLIKENLNVLEAGYMLNVFKSAMLEFDGELFDNTLEKLLEQKNFSEVFAEVLIPLLNEMGVLWHSGTIDPSHEHFISEKIKHTIIKHTNKQTIASPKKDSPSFVLYLPHQEIHEIGLLYANYEILSAGFSTIYLGANTPLESLSHVLKTKSDVIFIAYFTVQPEIDNLEKYIETFQNDVCSNTPCELWIMGPKALKPLKKISSIRFFNDLKLFKTHLENFSKA